MPGTDRSENLLEWLYQLRDLQRAKKAKSAWLIKGGDLPVERNRQGQMQWSLHPALDNIAVRSMLFFRQQIPPGGRSGVQRTPGGCVMFITAGSGFTMLDGVRHDWVMGDVVNIPIRVGGIVVQHGNDDPDVTAEFVQADVNVVDSLGVDRGALFEQIESVPESAGG
jgi:hypothetical protein